MPKITVPTDIKTINQITLIQGENEPSNCTSPAGHCFGSDGGSGIPENLKVAPGRGGEQEVWTLDAKGETIGKKEIYERCQYCLKLSYVRDKEN